MRIVFAATPEFTLPAAEMLIAGNNELVAVYTKPDARAGRGRKLSASPVKQWAQTRAVPVVQPETWDETAVNQLRDYAPDLMIVVAYGLLLPTAALAAPTLSCVNIHLSLLPRWRGAAPIVRAIEYGDETTGISLMKMHAKLDAGDIISQASCRVEPDDTAATLRTKLIASSVQLLELFLAEPEHALALAEPQTEDGVCYAPKLDKKECQIDWHVPASKIARKIRALNPTPVARTQYGNQSLRIWEAREYCRDIADEHPPGYVAELNDEGLIVVCGGGALAVRALQLAGKRMMSAADFACGHAIAGTVLR